MFKYLTLFLLLLLFSSPLKAQEAFKFENVKSLSDMQAFLSKEFKLNDPKNVLRDSFIKEGNATLISHPDDVNVEKYIYDINLCKLYVWRWNISADYNDNGELQQLYMNGLPVFEDGTPLKTPETIKANLPEDPDRKEAIYKVERPRPEASEGEKSLGFILYDIDGDKDTINDQLLIGAGPSNPNPKNFGKMRVYKNIDPWRSIFDMDDAKTIVSYSGDCSG